MWNNSISATCIRDSTLSVVTLTFMIKGEDEHGNRIGDIEFGLCLLTSPLLRIER